MSATSESSHLGKGRGLIFKSGVVLGVLVALLVIAYFVVTSGGFIKGVILPRVGSAMNADVTAREVSLSPWSELLLQGFKVQPKGKETLFEAEQIRARYSLWDIIRGKIVVQEAGVTAPVVTIVQNADGTSNLDPLIKKGAQQPTAPQAKKEKKPSAPLQVDIRNVYLKNARVNFTQTQKDGIRMTAQISEFDFTIDQIQNGQAANLKYSGNVSIDSVKSAPASGGTAQVKLSGAFALKLTPSLAPESVNGNARADVTKAGGAMSNLTALATIVDCDLSLTEIRKANLRVEQAGAPLVELRASGPFSAANSEGRLKVELTPIDRRVLNIVGGPLKIDFNKTAISSVNDIEIKQKGKVIAVNGQFLVNDFSATLTNGTTPTLNLKSAYAVNLDLNTSSGLIQQLSVNGTQNQAPFLTVSLSKPMPVAWGAGAGMPEEASMDLVVTNFNLADWAAFAGNLSPVGRLDTTLRVVSRQGGKQLTLDLNSGLSGFGAQLGTNQISGVGIRVGANAVIQEFKQITLNSYKLEVAKDGNAAMTASGSGTLNSQTKAGQIALQVLDVNQYLLAPFLAPALNGKQLASVSINANVTSAFGASNSVAVLGRLEITNLVVRAANQVSTSAPLSAQFKVDLGMQQQRLDLRQLQIALSPTDRAKNQIDFKGQVDMSNAKAINANLSIQSDSLDVTPFYDQFTGGAKPSAAPAKPASQPASAPVPRSEPPAMQLPVGLATVNLNMGKFLLREIEITNWQAAIRVETNRVTVKPFQLSLNGAPVTFALDANVGVPGYQYQVLLGIDKLEIEHLANSFMPDKPGMYKGLVLANATINGAGITDASLRRNLNGQISFSVTNAVIQITNGLLPSLIQPIAVALKVPEVTSDPLTSVSSVISIGKGKITVQTMKLLSAAFLADVRGDIQMAAPLANSPVSLPVTFALSQSLAKKIPYLSTLSDTNSDYVNIPDLVKLGGTLGKVKTEANLSAKSVLGAAEAIGRKFGGAKANEAMNILGGLLGGPTSTNNAPATTNSVSTNATLSQPPEAVNQLMDIFKKK